MLEVIPAEGSDILGKGAGAIVNVLAFENSREDFRKRIEEACKDLGLVLVELDEVEEFSARITKFEVDRSLFDLAREVKATHNPRFGTFHTYPKSGMT